MPPTMALDLPRRFALPPQAMGDGTVPLEFLHWTLYSCAALIGGAALPRLTEIYNYVVGQRVSGNMVNGLPANDFHTNMQAQRTIPKPKTFTVCGLRVVVSPLHFLDAADATNGNPQFGDDSAGAAVQNTDEFDDSVLIYNSMALRFRMGEKRYVEAPFWLLPANVGIGGLAATARADTSAATSWQKRVAIHTCGIGYSFAHSQKPVLWNQQNFALELLCEWTTNPTPTDNHYVFVLLDGILGREVQ